MFSKVHPLIHDRDLSVSLHGPAGNRSTFDQPEPICAFEGRGNLAMNSEFFAVTDRFLTTSPFAACEPQLHLRLHRFLVRQLRVVHESATKGVGRLIARCGVLETLDDSRLTTLVVS